MSEKTKYRLLYGRHFIGARRIGPGGIFKAYPDEVEWMRERIERVDGEEVAHEEASEPLRAASYRKEHRGGGRYRVVCEQTGEAVNDVLLSSDDADALIETLGGSAPDNEEE